MHSNNLYQANLLDGDNNNEIELETNETRGRDSDHSCDICDFGLFK